MVSINWTSSCEQHKGLFNTKEILQDLMKKAVALNIGLYICTKFWSVTIIISCCYYRADYSQCFLFTYFLLNKYNYSIHLHFCQQTDMCIKGLAKLTGRFTTLHVNFMPLAEHSRSSHDRFKVQERDFWCNIWYIKMVVARYDITSWFT